MRPEAVIGIDVPEESVLGRGRQVLAQNALPFHLVNLTVLILADARFPRVEGTNPADVELPVSLIQAEQLVVLGDLIRELAGIEGLFHRGVARLPVVLSIGPDDLRIVQRPASAGVEPQLVDEKKATQIAIEIVPPNELVAAGDAFQG